jgi:hypothetical protein
MTKSLVTADDVSQANPRALDDIQQTLDHVNEEIDALEVQFKAQMKVMSALMFEINQTETMQSPTPRSLADLNIKVEDLTKLTESYEIIDGMQAMLKTLTATASQLQVMFPGDSGPAKKMLSETLILQKKVKDRINDAAKFISGLAADKAPKVFDKFTDGIGTLIARCISYGDVENFLYMFTTKGGQVAFAHYFRMLRAVDENGNDFPELYIVISMLVGTAPTFYMTTLTEMETPSEILFARQVSNLREVARSLHSLLAMDSFQNTIGSTPLPLIIKKEKLTPEMFNSAEHIDRVYVEEELGTLVFRLKPTIKDKDSDLARSIVAQLYTDTLKIVSKFNGKMRPRCTERDGRVEVVFWAQRGAEAPAATADDLEALQVRFKLGDVATKKILRILNRENASVKVKAAMTAPVRNVVDTLMKSIKGGDLNEGNGQVGDWPIGVDFMGVSEELIAQIDAQFKKLKFVEGPGRPGSGLVKKFKNKEGTVEVLVHCLNPLGGQRLPGFDLHKNAPSTVGMSIVTVDVINTSMAEPVTAARVSSASKPNYRPCRTLSELSAELPGSEWDAPLDRYVVPCQSAGALVGIVHMLAQKNFETYYSADGNRVNLIGPHNFRGSLLWYKEARKVMLSGKDIRGDEVSEPTHASVSKRVKANVYEWQMKAIDVVKKASRSKDWQMGKLRTHDSVSWVCCPTERHLSAEICLDYVVMFLSQQFGNPVFNENSAGQTYKWTMPDATDKGCTNFVVIQSKTAAKGCLTATFGHTQSGTRRMSSVTAAVTKTTEQARIKDNDEYMWRQYTGPSISLNFRGKPLPLERGEKIGLRLSSNGKSKRMVIERLGLTRVFTLDENLEKQLIPNVKICKAPSMLFASTGKKLTASGEAARASYGDALDDLQDAVAPMNAKAKKMFEGIKHGVGSDWSLDYTPGNMDEDAAIVFKNLGNPKKTFTVNVIIDGTFCVVSRSASGQLIFSPSLKSVADLNKLIGPKLLG